MEIIQALNNGLFGEDENTSIARKAAERRIINKHNKQQSELIKQGWRYINVTDKLKMFVPCDKDGNPTKLGIEKIEQRKKILGLT